MACGSSRARIIKNQVPQRAPQRRRVEEGVQGPLCALQGQYKFFF